MAGTQPNLFEQLRAGAGNQTQQEKKRAAEAQELRHEEQTQQRLASLVDTNTTLPCNISNVHILGADKTRKSLLKSIVSPLVDRPFLLSEALSEIAATGARFGELGIYHQPVSVSITPASQSDPLSTPSDIDVYFSVTERSRVSLQTGTDVGNTEGQAYGRVNLLNLFGGAESLRVNAAYGTRTRSAYSAVFSTPVLNNPYLRLDVGGNASSTEKTWASHEESSKGGWTTLRWLTSGGHKHELSYSAWWRQITGLASNASPTVRGDAGDSVKSAIDHTWISDRRDNPVLPSRGYLFKTRTELAGYGPLKGDVSFLKTQAETQAVFPIPIPGVRNSGTTFTLGFRAGVLCPLALATAAVAGDSKTPQPQPSRINDRFQLGGPTDVRGFRISGLGPRDGPDAVGGDVFAAGSAKLLVPVPGVGPERPLRLQFFANGGRLLALKEAGASDGRKGAESSTATTTTSGRVISTIKELGNELPSTAAGVGLVYSHSMARFELNFSLPLVVRKGEDPRKGLQFGIGIDFL